MAARRGKSQARRNSGNGGLPGWAWAVIGALVAVVLVLGAPKFFDSKTDFVLPRANPDAQPAPASDEGAAATETPATPAAAAEDPDYDFYTLLPGKEVQVSDAELAASEQAEAEPTGEADADAELPKPVTEPAASASTGDTEQATAPADGARYLLQAGAFEAAAQAEELKARLALLGLSARVEPAAIGGRTVYRVRMGPYSSAGDLAEAKRKLAANGLKPLAIKAK